MWLYTSASTSSFLPSARLCINSIPCINPWCMQVWASYEDTIANKNIHAIPYFVFTEGGRGGGPFRPDGGGTRHVTVRGSADVQTFVEVFETLSQAATAA